MIKHKRDQLVRLHVASPGDPVPGFLASLDPLSDNRKWPVRARSSPCPPEITSNEHHDFWAALGGPAGGTLRSSGSGGPVGLQQQAPVQRHVGPRQELHERVRQADEEEAEGLGRVSAGRTPVRLPEGRGNQLEPEWVMTSPTGCASDVRTFSRFCLFSSPERGSTRFCCCVILC